MHPPPMPIHLRKETDPVSEILVLLEYKKIGENKEMESVSNHECNSLKSEAFTIQNVLVTIRFCMGVKLGL
jgi:hypothetical protein